jgi:hypothetical protein
VVRVGRVFPHPVGPLISGYAGIGLSRGTCAGVGHYLRPPSRLPHLFEFLGFLPDRQRNGLKRLGRVHEKEGLG